MLATIDDRRKRMAAEPPRLLRGDWDVVITVNGDQAHVEALSIDIPLLSSGRRKNGPRQRPAWRDLWDETWHVVERNLKAKGHTPHAGLHSYLLPHAQSLIKMFQARCVLPTGGHRKHSTLHDWWTFCKLCKLTAYDAHKGFNMPQCALDELLPMAHKGVGAHKGI